MTTEGQIHQHVADTIKAWRKTREMSQSSLGEKIGMHQTAIAKIENNERRVDFATVLQIAQVLEIPWQSFEYKSPGKVGQVSGAFEDVYQSIVKWFDALEELVSRHNQLHVEVETLVTLLRDASFPSSVFSQESLTEGAQAMIDTLSLMSESAPPLDGATLGHYQDLDEKLRQFRKKLKEAADADS